MLKPAVYHKLHVTRLLIFSAFSNFFPFVMKLE